MMKILKCNILAMFKIMKGDQYELKYHIHNTSNFDVSYCSSGYSTPTNRKGHADIWGLKNRMNEHQSINTYRFFYNLNKTEMLNFIKVEQLDLKKAEEIAQAISDLSQVKGKNKTLPLVLENTNGDYKLAINLAKQIHASKVDLIIEAKGNLEAAGCILAAAGLKKERHASLDATFTPFESEGSSKGDRLTPTNQAILGVLSCLQAHRRGLKSMAPKADTLSVYEAKKYKIIDVIDKFERKQSEDKNNKKKSPKRKSSKK